VTVQHGRQVSRLKSEDFQIYEDNSEQRIVQFIEGPPISIALVVDASGSMLSKWEAVTQGVSSLLRASAAGTQFLLITLAQKPRVACSFTDDPEAILHQVLATRQAGRNARLEAIGMALEEMRNASHKARAVVLFTDADDGGEDNYAGGLTFKDLKRILCQSDAELYVLCAGCHEWPAGAEPRGQAQLRTLAEETGGRLQSARDPRSFVELAAETGSELREQYLLGYSSPNRAADGKAHIIRLALRSRTGHRAAMTYRQRCCDSSH